MKDWLFGLYSLENAVFFGVRQYLHFGDSLLFGKIPEWAENVQISDAAKIKITDLDKTKKTFVSALNYTKRMSEIELDVFFKTLSELMSPDSTIVFELPVTAPYRDVERLMSKNNFLIFEQQKASERYMIYLAVKKGFTEL